MLRGYGSGRGGALARLGVFAVLLILTLPGLSAQTVELASRVHPSQISDAGAFPEPRSFSGDPGALSLSLSDDGRYAVFVSPATNLVPDQKDVNFNFRSDVFVRDLVAGTTTLVSRSMAPPTTTGNRGSDEAAISGDGRFIAFASRATDLVPGQISDVHGQDEDLLLYDRLTGTTSLVAAALPQSFAATFTDLALSFDGRYIVFTSENGTLVPGDDPGSRDVFLYDRIAKTLRRVSQGTPVHTSSRPVISADGSFVAFLSGSTDAEQGSPDAYLFERTSGALTRVGPAGSVVMSADGRYIATQSLRSTALYDRETRQTTVLASNSGLFVGKSLSISADGRFLAFLSTATNLVPGQTPGTFGANLFLYDRVSRIFSLISHRPGTPTAPADQAAEPTISGDGRFVAFLSTSPDLVSGQVDQEESPDVFLFDRLSGTVRLVSGAAGSATATGNAASYAPRISADGTRVVFHSLAGDLVPGVKDLNEGQDVFAHETASGNTSLVSRHAPGLPSLSPAAESTAPSVSADGRFVAFQSETPHLISGQEDSNGTTDVFLYDRSTRTTILVSRASGFGTRTAKGRSLNPVISANGQYIAFFSNAPDLAPGADDPDHEYESFLFDRVSGTTVIVGSLGTSAFTLLPSRQHALSADGRWVVFSSDATDLVPGQSDTGGSGTSDVFLWDRVTRSTILVSHSNAGAAVAGNRDSGLPLLSADGRYVLFLSDASDLVPGQVDGNFQSDLFLFDRTTGVTTLVSHAPDSPTTALSIYDFYSASPDARFITFASRGASRLGEDPSIYLYDRTQGKLQVVIPSGFSPRVSADGRYIAFLSNQELVPGAPPGSYSQPYLYDRLSGSFSLITGPGTLNSGPIRNLVLSANGRYLAFANNATNLIPGQTAAPGRTGDDIFLFDRVTGTLTLVSHSPTSPVIAMGRSSQPLLTDGGQVAFISSAGLDKDDFNDLTDVYLFSLTPPPPAGPTPLPACTLLDTRRRANRPILTSNVQRTVAVRGACGVPATAKQVVVKVTVFNPSGKGNLRFYPGAITAAPSGMLRFERGATRSESFTLPLSPNGTLTILPFVAGKGTVHAAVEVNGYSQ